MNKIDHMTNMENKKIFIARYLILIILTLQISSCTGQVKEKSANDPIEIVKDNNPLILRNNNTTFPQIHTNLKWNGKGVCKVYVSRYKRELLVWNKWKWDYPLRWANT
jgi:hypothetical protein